MTDNPNTFFRIQSLIAATCFFIASPGVAQEEQPPWHYCEPYSANAKELLAAARERDDPEDASYETLLSDTQIEFVNDGRIKRSRHSIFRILTRAGVNRINIDEEWSPWFEKKPVVDARVLSRRGIVSRLDPSTIEEAATDQITDLVLSTDKRIQAPLPSVTVGSVIEMTTVEEQLKPFSDQGYLATFGCGDFIGADRWRLRIVAPDSIPLKFEQLGIQLEPEVSKSNGTTTWTFTRSAVESQEHYESNLPSHISNIPIIRVSSGKSWQAFSKHYSAVVEKQLAESDLENPIGKIETDNINEKIDHVLEVLQNRVRYTGLEFGISAIVPKPPSETWKNGFGDCKDKSVLLVELLRHIGIDAKVALLKAGSRLDISPTLPAMNSFDHAIVYIPKEDLWIDPTVKFNPVGILPASDQGRWALLADPETTELVKTPVHENTSNQRNVDWTYELKEGQPSVISMKVKATGNIASSYRDYYSSDTKKALKKRWLETCKEAYGASKLLEYGFSDPYDFSQPFELNGKFVGFENAVVTSEDAICQLDPSTVLSRLPVVLFEAEDDEASKDEDSDDSREQKSEKEKRTADFVFDTLYQGQVRYTIVAPPGYVIGKVPESATAQVRDIVFKALFKKESDRRCVATFEVDTGKGVLTAKEFEQFKKQLSKITGDANVAWNYEFVFTNRANDFVLGGRYKEAVAILRKDLEQNPNDAFLKMRLANVMMDMGFGKAARAEARKAVAVRPDSAYLQEQLATVLTHDLIGRHLVGEYDFTGAEAAYKKVIELDPKQATAALNLAILYEHGPVGRRYQNEKQLLQAIELYEDCHANNDYRLFGNYLLCLVHSRQHEKLLKKLELMENDSSYEYTRSVSLAVVHGVQKAVAHVGKLYPDQNEASLFLESCAQLANVTAEYQTAIEIYDAIAPVLPAKNFKPRSEFVKQLAEAKKSSFDKDDPRHPVRALLFWGLTDGRQLDQLSDVVEFPEMEKMRDQVFLDFLVPTGVSRLRKLELGRTERVSALLDLLELETNSIDRYTVVSVSGEKSKVTDAFFQNIKYLVEKTSDGTLRVVPTVQAYNKISLRAMELVENQQHDEARKLLRFMNRQFGSRLALLAPMTARPMDVVYQLANKKDNDQLKLCAASYGYSEKAIAFAKEQLPKQDKAMQLQLLRYIAGVVSYRNTFTEKEQCSPYFKRIVELAPSQSAREALVSTLSSERKFSEVDQLLAEYADKRVNKQQLSTMKIRLQQCQGKFEEASKAIRELLDNSPDVPNANFFLWNAMFMDQLPDDILDIAQKSVRGYGNDDRLMHTYATVLARLQKFPEAKAALGLAVRTRNVEKLIPADNYVLGLIAEGSGLVDVAKSYYSDAIQDDDTSPVATSVLAKRRLKALRATEASATPK